MNTTRRQAREESNKAKPNVLVIGETPFGLAVAEYLTEDAQSVTVVSEDQPADVENEVKLIHHKLADANDVRTLASEVTDVDLIVVIAGSDSEALLQGYLARREFDPCTVVASLSNPANGLAFEDAGVDRIDMPRILAEQIRGRYQ